MKPIDISLIACLRELALAAPDKKLLGSGAGWLTAQQVYACTEAIAHQLYTAGIRPGSFAALRADRTADTVLTLLALRYIGTAAVLTDPHSEPETVLAECESHITIDSVLTPHSPGQMLLRQGASKTVISLTPAKAPSPALPCNTQSKDAGFVIFTSGSTGKKKAVVLSDYNLINNLADSQPLGCYREDDIALGVLPLEHVFGLVLLAGMAFLRYAVYFPDRTDICSLLETIEKEKITRMNGVPSLYRAIAEHRQGHDLSSLRAGFIGGAPVTAGQLEQLEQQLGMTLIPVYGMSECVGISCADGRESAAIRTRGVGRVYSMNTVRILDETGSSLPAGQAGEVWVNGPTRMLGYWGHPMADDAFLATGDLGFLEADGTLHITGRKKDLIIRNGRNISPRRIEDALLSLPGVRAAAVVGVPDAQAGEIPCAMVAGIADPAQLKNLLPKNELPTRILCVEELPLTFSGKPDKIRIREVLVEWMNG